MKSLAVFFLVSVLFSMVLLAHGEEKTGILASGFGIVADGKFCRFDEAGNTQALALLKATETESNFKVRVEGHFEED